MNTLDSLIARALVVMNETRKKLNTATRVGSLLRDILTFISNMLLGILLKGSKSNLAAIQAITTKAKGDTYRAEDTGHFWTWDGTAWNDIGTIIPANVATINDLTTYNKFNTLVDINWIDGIYISTVNGSTGTNANFSSSDYIEFSESDMYLVNAIVSGSSAAMIAFYTLNKTFISAIGQGTFQNYIIEFPENTAFFRVCINNVNKPTYSLLRNLNLGFIKNLAIEANEDDINRIDLELAKKIDVPFGKINVNLTTGIYINFSGLVASIGTMSASDYIEKKGTYRLNSIQNASSAATVAFYTATKDFISYIPPGNYTDFIIPFPSNAIYFRLSVVNANLSSFSLYGDIELVLKSDLLVIQSSLANFIGRDEFQLKDNLSQTDYVLLSKVGGLNLATLLNSESNITSINNTSIEASTGHSLTKVANSITVLNSAYKFLSTKNSGTQLYSMTLNNNTQQKTYTFGTWLLKSQYANNLVAQVTLYYAGVASLLNPTFLASELITGIQKTTSNTNFSLTVKIIAESNGYFYLQYQVTSNNNADRAIMLPDFCTSS